MEQWLDSLRTGPEESIMQIGNMDDQAAASDLMECMAEFNRWLQEETKGCCVVLDMSLHLDEATPHYQVRRVWQYDDHGTLKIGQEEALKRLGYELPNPEEKKSRYNNRKMVLMQLLVLSGMTFAKLMDMRLIENQKLEENMSQRLIM